MPAGRQRRAPGRRGRRSRSSRFTTLEAARRIDLGPYGLWTEPERLAFQVDRAYRELSGVPWDVPVDTSRVFAEVAALRDAYASAG